MERLGSAEAAKAEMMRAAMEARRERENMTVKNVVDGRRTEGEAEGRHGLYSCPELLT
jgi:hypothetical protein